MKIKPSSRHTGNRAKSGKQPGRPRKPRAAHTTSETSLSHDGKPLRGLLGIVCSCPSGRGN